jgi:hypothetical protein
MRTRNLSYQLHDGRELELMLSGIKPLAFFYDDADFPSAESEIPEDDFDGFVKEGRFCKGEFVATGAVDPRTGHPVKVRYVFYSTTEEQWRIPAMIMVIQTMLQTKKRPDEGLDRLTGSLLGYTDAQNDEYISTGKY